MLRGSQCYTAMTNQVQDMHTEKLDYIIIHWKGTLTRRLTIQMSVISMVLKLYSNLKLQTDFDNYYEH